MIPGLGKQLKGMNAQIDEKEMVWVEAIIHIHDPGRKAKPGIINGSRKKRIARGSGTRVQDVNRLLKQFDESRKMMKQLADLGQRKANEGCLP
jgi:signal recognition particle subunit SRP54